ncbi:uncharacterized protein F5Z01DRAFT_635336 [Emericellopsis atlantica]|uniref:Uncharacterized protein n=1 Tax=Emericellopsis atlantica TaxID=2614577 RepID=A0A9P8CQA5_9HYPO|nr:uncharacterized protein F5Z01DRAFT_635336 [Emericellopsis atlantica]KAG9255719.1 hypothetical protein F5Z01DRAFT_635336 [Emericellopsis atlantica]
MGLRFFVAPVESDLPPRTSLRKSTARTRGVSRGGIRIEFGRRINRRTGPVEVNAAGLTRYLSDNLNDDRVHGADRRSNRYEPIRQIRHRPRVSRDQALLRELAEYIQNKFEVSWEQLTPEDIRQRGVLRLELTRLFGRNWASRDFCQSQQDLENRTWMLLHGQADGGPRLETRDHGGSLQGPYYLDLPPPPIWAIRGTIPRGIERPSRGEDYNGLGDRTRSPSPGHWDTLLTTLTPDPQPPSASTSFVSNSAAQSAMAASSSNTSQSEHHGATIQDGPCESDAEDEPSRPRSNQEETSRTADSAEQMDAVVGEWTGLRSRPSSERYPQLFSQLSDYLDNHPTRGTRAEVVSAFTEFMDMHIMLSRLPGASQEPPDNVVSMFVQFWDSRNGA